MKRINLFAVLLTIATLPWLIVNECKAQKLTEVNKYYFPKDKTYSAQGNGIYWDATGDGKLERLVPNYKYYHYPEGGIAAQSVGGPYYYPELFAEDKEENGLIRKDGGYYICIPDFGDEHIIKDKEPAFIQEKSINEPEFKIRWPFNNQSNSIEDNPVKQGLFTIASFIKGSELSEGNGRVNKTYFQKYQSFNTQVTNRNENYAIIFYVKPINYLKYKPKSLEFNAAINAHGGTFDIVIVADGEEKVIAENIEPQRCNVDPYYSHYKYDISMIGECKELIIKIYLLQQNMREINFFCNDITVTGELMGTQSMEYHGIESEKDTYRLLGLLKNYNDASGNSILNENYKEILEKLDDEVLHKIQLYNCSYHTDQGTMYNFYGPLYSYKKDGHLYLGFANYYGLYQVDGYTIDNEMTDGNGWPVALYLIQSQADYDYLRYYLDFRYVRTYKNGKLYSTEKMLSSSDYEYTAVWEDTNWNVVKVMQGVTEDIDETYDFNADGVPDFLNAKDRFLYLSGPERYSVVDVAEPYGMKDVIIIDINHDGKLDFFGYVKADQYNYTDFVGYNITVTGYVPVVYLQNDDGSFISEPLALVTDKEELRNAMYSTGGDGSFNSYFGIPPGFAYARSLDPITNDPVKIESTKTFDIMDVNNDGYSDILYTNGRAILSLPDGRYYAAQVTGEFSICDLNNDGIKDIVTYDKENKKVLLDLSQHDGTFEQTNLIDNGTITAVYSHDLDGDGLIDIMLQAREENATYSFLVFFKNKGDGTFEKKERFLEGSYSFSRPLDLNNNGVPSILALKQKDNNLSSDSFLYRIDWDKNFVLSEQVEKFEDKTIQMGDSGLWGYVNSDYQLYKWDTMVMDYDGDGSLDVPVYFDYHSDTNTKYGLYTPAGKQNTAPLQMIKPIVTYDKQSSTVKVSWQEGKDSESACGDLTYIVSAGTSVGEADLLYYKAGRSSYCVLNTGTWPSGKMYISVCATDPNGLQGKWSEAVSFDNVIQQPDFLLSANSMTTEDTLIVTSFKNETLTYEAKPDGIVLNNEEGIAKIIFPTSGVKTIVATKDGQITKERSVHVAPFGKDKNTSFSNRDCYFDLNQNGKNELFDSYLKYYSSKDGNFVKYPSMFNADLRITPLFIIDKNMDGLPDVYGRVEKNGTSYNWMINRGDMEFELYNDDVKLLKGDYKYWVDINNDGYLDYYIRAEQNSNAYLWKTALYINRGDYTFKEVAIDGYILDAADADRDGNIDLLVEKGFSDGVVIMRNYGNLEFKNVYEGEEIHAFLMNTGDHSQVAENFCQFADVNDDGILDIMETVDKPYHEPSAIVFDKNMKWKEKISIPHGTPLYMDMENEKLTCLVRHIGGRVQDTICWRKESLQGKLVLDEYWGGYYDWYRGGHPFLSDYNNEKA